MEEWLMPIPVPMFILPNCWTSTVGGRGVYMLMKAMRYIMLWVPGHSCVQLQRAEEDGAAAEQQQNFPTLTGRQLAVCLMYM